MFNFMYLSICHFACFACLITGTRFRVVKVASVVSDYVSSNDNLLINLYISIISSISRVSHASSHLEIEVRKWHLKETENVTKFCEVKNMSKQPKDGVIHFS